MYIGIILSVVDHYAAKVKMIESGDALLLDQEHVETVIPRKGGEVLVVNGEYHGEQGILQDINTKDYTANIKLHGTNKIVKLPYEHFSKVLSK